MAIQELAPGESCASPHVPLRIALTGDVAGRGLELFATGASAEQQVRSVSATEAVVLPRSGRIVLGVRTAAGGSLPPGTVVGLSVRAERKDPAQWQALVVPSDVGALVEHTFAELTFGGGNATLTALEAPQARPAPGTEAPRVRRGRARAAEAAADEAWAQPGLYALREALAGGPPPAAPAGWGLVLDGSLSMRRLSASGSVVALVELVSGILRAWSGAQALGCAVAGVEAVVLDDARSSPAELARQAFGEQEPSSWSSLHDASHLVMDSLPRKGVLVLVTDGVPGDVRELATLARGRADLRYLVVTVGVSARGLVSDGRVEWFEEELAGLEELATLPHVEVVALAARSDADGVWGIDLSGARPAELAGRLLGVAAVPS